MLIIDKLLQKKAENAVFKHLYMEMSCFSREHLQALEWQNKAFTTIIVSINHLVVLSITCQKMVKQKLMINFIADY